MSPKLLILVPIGCVKPNSSSTCSSISGTSITACIEYCQDLGLNYSYAAINKYSMNYQYCICLTLKELQSADFKSPSKCNKICDSNNFCGGDEKNASITTYQYCLKYYGGYYLYSVYMYNQTLGIFYLKYKLLSFILVYIYLQLIANLN